MVAELGSILPDWLSEEASIPPSSPRACDGEHQHDASSRRDESGPDDATWPTPQRSWRDGSHPGGQEEQPADDGIGYAGDHTEHGRDVVNHAEHAQQLGVMYMQRQSRW